MQTPPETFWGFTATAWTAIGSLVSAISIVTLAAFNVFYLKAARAASRAADAQAQAGQKAAEAASQQAQAANKSLSELRNQFKMQEIAQKEIALTALNEVARNAKGWSQSLHTEKSIDDKASLIPPNWDQAMVYVAQQVPSVMREMIDTEKQISETECQLNDVIHVPLSMRAGLLTGQKIQPLCKSLLKTAEDVEKIAEILRSHSHSKN